MREPQAGHKAIHAVLSFEERLLAAAGIQVNRGNDCLHLLLRLRCANGCEGLPRLLDSALCDQPGRAVGNSREHQQKERCGNGRDAKLPSPLPRAEMERCNEEIRKVRQQNSNDGTWKHGFNRAHAKEVMKTGSSELSIWYHPALKQWLAVMLEPSGFSDKVILRRAPDLTGPWTEGQIIYPIPEMQPGPSRDKNTFC